MIEKISPEQERLFKKLRVAEIGCFAIAGAGFIGAATESHAVATEIGLGTVGFLGSVFGLFLHGARGIRNVPTNSQRQESIEDLE